MPDTTVPLGKWPTTAAQLVFQSLRHPLTRKVIEIGEDKVVVRSKAERKTRRKHEGTPSSTAPSHAG